VERASKSAPARLWSLRLARVRGRAPYLRGSYIKRSDGFILLMHAQHGSSAVAFSTLEDLIAETKSYSVESTITTVRTKNRLVPKL
jgi:hypothetical protein